MKIKKILRLFSPEIKRYKYSHRSQIKLYVLFFKETFIIICPDQKIQDGLKPTLRVFNLKNLKNEVCSKQNKRIRISYNTETGYFDFIEKKKNKIDKSTIEGTAIESYLDKYNLSVQWIDEGGYWGSRDENGTFNGVIGRVRG